MAFSMSVTDDEKKHFFLDIDELLNDAMTDRFDFDKRRIAVFNAYRNRVRPKSDPWDGCSNSSVPLLTRAVERTTIQTMATISPRGSFTELTAVPVAPSPLEECPRTSGTTSEPA